MTSPGRPDELRDRAGILLVNLEGSNFDVHHRGLNVGVAHQLHECGQTDPGAHHIASERVAEAVGVGRRDDGASAMITGQRSQSRGRHARASGVAFKGHEQRRG
jgi:hypothetical protein